MKLIMAQCKMELSKLTYESIPWLGSDTCQLMICNALETGVSNRRCQLFSGNIAADIDPLVFGRGGCGFKHVEMKHILLIHILGIFNQIFLVLISRDLIAAKPTLMGTILSLAPWAAPEYVKTTTYRWLNARLQYLHCVSNGDTAVCTRPST